MASGKKGHELQGEKKRPGVVRKGTSMLMAEQVRQKRYKKVIRLLEGQVMR